MSDSSQRTIEKLREALAIEKNTIALLETELRELAEMLAAAGEIRFPDGTFLRYWAEPDAWFAYPGVRALMDLESIKPQEFATAIEAYRALREALES